MKNLIRSILFIGICLIGLKTEAQQSDTIKTYFDEKFGIILGFGTEYSLFAPRLHVKAFKNGYVQASCFYYLPYKFIWNLGFEYRFPLKNDRWCPYTQISFGDNRPTSIFFGSSSNYTFVRRIFQSPAIGAGIKFRYTKDRKFYLRIGMNYTVPIKVEKEFAKDLNSKVGTNFKPTSRLTPSIGLSISLRK